MKQALVVILALLGIFVLTQSKSIMNEVEDESLGAANMEEFEAENNNVNLEEELIGSDIKMAPGVNNPWGRK